MTKWESLFPYGMYFYFIFTTVQIACITLLLKIFINSFMEFLYAKHAFHYSNTASFTVAVFTNHSVLFVTFSVSTGFSSYISLTVDIRMVKNTARTSITEALIVKLHWVLFFIFSPL